MRHDKQGTTCTMEERKMSEGNKKKIYNTVYSIVRKVKNDPSKVVVVPVLCAGTILLAMGIYYNMYVYHIKKNLWYLSSC